MAREIVLINILSESRDTDPFLHTSPLKSSKFGYIFSFEDKVSALHVFTRLSSQYRILYNNYSYPVPYPEHAEFNLWYYENVNSNEIVVCFDVDLEKYINLIDISFPCRFIYRTAFRMDNVARYAIPNAMHYPNVPINCVIQDKRGGYIV